MKSLYRIMAILLAVVLLAACIPAGTVTVSAADGSGSDPLGGSSGSEIGDGGGGGNAAGSGSSNMVAAGVTMQVIYSRYDQCFNRYNSHGKVIEAVQSGKSIPWNDTGRDKGETMTTVLDTFTITPHTFLIKSEWDEYPYVYHFPYEALEDDKCSFTWAGFTSYWFEHNNPGGKPSTYPRIVRNEEYGSKAIEDYLARIILGNSYGAWDKLDVAKGETVETDSSLFAAVLKYLGASDRAVQNYLDAYFGKLSITQDGDVLIPTIVWSWVSAENLGGTNRIYTIGDVDSHGSPTPDWLKTAYPSPDAATEGYGTCTWMKESTDTMVCKLMIGASHTAPSPHTNSIWANSAPYLFGTGYVNRIQTQVDATAEDGTNTFYYLRGYWTPYGTGNGSVEITKTNVSGSEKLGGAEFTLYRDADCTVPVTDADYDSLSTSDTGYVSASVRRTNAYGKAAWTGLYTGLYFMKETKAPEGYQVNVDASGGVEVREIPVSNGTTGMTLTNAEKTRPVSLKKSIQASGECMEQIKGNPLYSLAGAEYTVSRNGKVVETLVTDSNGNAAATQQYNVGDVLTVRETKAPPGFCLDTKTYTHTVTSGENVICVSDIPVFDPPFVLTKVDKDTTTPQGDGSFAGAVFQWEYFANANWSGKANRTWYFATDQNGRCQYSQDYLASGYASNALYVAPDGTAQLPLGTLKITEVQSCPGYQVIDRSLYCTIGCENGTARHSWTEGSAAILRQIAQGEWGVEEPLDTGLFGSVSLDKFDSETGQTAQGEATLEGAAFEVINRSTGSVKVGDKVYAPGAAVCTVTTDRNGHAKTGNILPVGTYSIRESAAPTGYLLNTDWEQTFSVTAEKKDHSFSYEAGTGCPETVISGSIRISKKIVDPVDQLTAPEAGAVFSVTDKNGTVADTIITDADGIGISKNLPYGTYTVTQTSGQTGTVLAQSWTVTIDKHGKVCEYSKEDPLWTALVTIHKVEAGGKKPLVAVFELCQRLPDGTVKVLETGTTDTDGSLTFARKIVYSDGVCNQSAYFIREKEAPAGYVLDTREYPVSCTENAQVVTVTVENSPVDGKLELHKQSTQGRPMEGVEFLLEFSLDAGNAWAPVVWREADAASAPGSCTSSDLHDGRLLTDANGIAAFTGLQVYTADGSPILYRVTETRTLNGATLLPDPIWEGDLLTEKEGEHQFEVVLGVANSPILELPETGSPALRLFSAAAAICALAGVLLLARKKKEQ